MNVSPTRYNSIAIILHWVMALAFLAMFTCGLIMVNVELERATQFKLYQWHKSGGVLLLFAFAIRLGWRLFSRVPELPGHFPKMEKVAAKFGHWGLYGFMLAMPLTGWLMVSASVYGLPTIVFGWFEWPHIPGLQGNSDVEHIAKLAHLVMAIGFFLFILAHIAGFLKHLVIDKENLLSRMWWGKE